EVPLQLSEYLGNPRIVEPVHFHRKLRDRREQFVWRGEKRFPFSAFDVHLDDHTPARIAVLANLVFQRVEETRIPVARPISDAFVVKDKSAAVADWPRRIETIVFVNGNVISARHFACPVVVWANAVRVGCIDRLNQIFAHQVSAVIGAAEARKRAVRQNDGLKFRKDRFAQLAPRRAARQASNHDGGRGSESDDDECNAYEWSFNQRLLHWSPLFRPFSSWQSFMMHFLWCSRKPDE